MVYGDLSRHWNTIDITTIYSTEASSIFSARKVDEWVATLRLTDRIPFTYLSHLLTLFMKSEERTAMLRPIHQEDYAWKTQPYDHQRDIFHRSRDRTGFALLMDMGTGKSKVTIDTAAWNYLQRRIDCLVIIAPNGVHSNWTQEGGEIDLHMPDWTNYVQATWASYLRKPEVAALEKLFDPKVEGLRVVSMNIEAFGNGTTQQILKKSGMKKRPEDRTAEDFTPHGFMKRLTNTFNVMFVIDEASKIKTPGAKRTRNLNTLSRSAVIKRILTGTLVTNSPLDAYAPMKLIIPDIWEHCGSNFTSFKNQYAEFRRVKFKEKKTGKEREFDEIVGYKNIDELTAIIDEHSYRITKDECVDLPPKIFQQRYVELTPQQRKIYNDIAQRSIIELEDDEELSITNVLTRALRLQQVLGGFVPKEEFAPVVPIEGPNPRITALLDIVEELDGKAIIWARFRAELDLIEKTLRKEYGRKAVVAYHGGVNNDDRKAAKEAFQKGDARFFVGQPHSGGMGLTLTAANTVIYYSNDFSLEARLQSEDRAHRIGQNRAVNYVDIECRGTLDTKVIEALRAKKDLAELINRDEARKLLAMAA